MFSHLREGIFNHLSKSGRGKQFWKLKAKILIKQWSDITSSLSGSIDWKNRTQLLPIQQKWIILFLSRHGEHCQGRSYCVSALWRSQQPIAFHFCHSVTRRQVRRDIEMLQITETNKGTVKGWESSCYWVLMKWYHHMLTDATPGLYPARMINRRNKQFGSLLINS